MTFALRSSHQAYHLDESVLSSGVFLWFYWNLDAYKSHTELRNHKVWKCTHVDTALSTKPINYELHGYVVRSWTRGQAHCTIF